MKIIHVKLEYAKLQKNFLNKTITNSFSCYKTLYLKTILFVIKTENFLNLDLSLILYILVKSGHYSNTRQCLP